MMSAETLNRPLDTAGNRVFGLPIPAGPGEPTYVDSVTSPMPPGTASPGTSKLAAAADHVHPAASVDYDLILASEPASPSNTYTPTYSGGLLVSETWTNLASQIVKSVTYSYSGGLVISEVRQAYDTSTGLVAAQITSNNFYSAGVFQYSLVSRDVGGYTNPSIDALLELEPVSTDLIYTPTYGGVYVSNEEWRSVSTTLKLKTIDYTYSLQLLLATEVRRVYAADGTTVVGRITITYGYTGGLLTSISQTRDV